MHLEHQGQVEALGEGMDFPPTGAKGQMKGRLWDQCQGSPRVPTPYTPLLGSASPRIPHSPKASHIQLGDNRKVSKNYKAIANKLRQPGLETTDM